MNVKGEYKYVNPRFNGKNRKPGQKKLISRQRLYQIRVQKKNKCVKCGQKRVGSKDLCQNCLLVRSRYRAKGKPLEWTGPIEA